METMLALVKKEAKPGLWLDEVPMPRIGINDVLIKVLRTGICGTDVHIETWDAWAKRTVPVPLVIAVSRTDRSFIVAELSRVEG